jgi:hypothetical protein
MTLLVAELCRRYALAAAEDALPAPDTDGLVGVPHPRPPHATRVRLTPLPRGTVAQ